MKKQTTCPKHNILKVSYGKNNESVCKTCRSDYMRDYYNRNPEARIKSIASSKRWRLANPDINRNSQLKHHFKKNYGLPLETWNELRDLHNNLCAICRRSAAQSSKVEARLHIDHDHKTNTIRGLLCGRCNRAIGHFQEDTNLMRLAISYLENPPYKVKALPTPSGRHTPWPEALEV